MNTNKDEVEKPFSIIEDPITEVIVDDLGPALLVVLKKGSGCPSCGCEKGLVYPRGPHLRLDCYECGKYIKFVPKAQIIRTSLMSVVMSCS